MSVTPENTGTEPRRDVRWISGISAQLLILALVTVLPLLVGSALRIVARSREGRAAIERDVEHTTRLVTARLDERLKSTDALLIGLTSTVRVDSLQQAYNDALFRGVLKRMPSRYSNFFGFEEHGARLGSALHSARLDSVRGQSREYFEVLMRDGGFAVGKARQSTGLNDRSMIVSLARALTDTTGHITGIVGASLRIDSLADLVKVDIALPPQSVIAVHDTSGNVIASYMQRDSASLPAASTDSAASVVKKERPDTSARSIAGADGITRIFGYARPHDAPWIVSVGVPERAAFAPRYEEIRRDLVAGGVALLLAFTAAVLLGRRIAKPLDALTTDALSIAKGKAGHRTRVRAKSEVGVLADAFNQMADTVERRNAALADGERRYRLLFDSNPLPMYAWDAETLAIVATNEAAQEHYRYTREEFLEKKILDLMDPSEHERFEHQRVPFNDERVPAQVWLHRTATGKRLEVEIVTTPSRRLGRATWLSVSIDVTARRAAERALVLSEEQLRQSQKMEAMGAFAGGIAHDFNNLLTGMLGYCDLAIDAIGNNQAAADDVQEVKALAMRGAELTRQILTVSRKQVVQQTVLDVNEVVRGLDRLLRRLIGEHIIFNTRLAPDLGSIRADAGQLEQVLLNLSANARDAMQPGGTLTIRTFVLTSEYAVEQGLDSGEWIAICVTDTGAGMTDEVRQRVFEPFFTTKERGKGTGLGLALAYAMVEQSGGVIRVVSQLGEGTTFLLFFPRLSEAAAIELANTEPPVILEGTETILLAEDEDSVRAVAKESLERRGYRVLAASDGKGALALARAYGGELHLLVTDVVMPGMTGRELAEQLLLERPETPVLFASGYTDDAVVLHGVRTDELSFIQKPFSPLSLVTRVREVLDHARAQTT